VGATTLAVNLAGFLAREGRRVVLIDLSPTAGHVALMLRLRPKPNWVDLPLDLNSQNLSHAFLKHDSGLHVLAAPPQPQPDGLNPNIFKSAVQLMNGVFTDIIIDCAPVLDPATRAAIAAAGRVLLPLAPEVTAVQTMTGTLAAMAALQVPPEATRLVLNYPSPSGTLLPARIENALKHPIDATLPYDPAVASALLGGTPLFAAQPRPPYIAALASLAAKL
jgi:cellulose biosynthesis protein BcsQ